MKRWQRTALPASMMTLVIQAGLARPDGHHQPPYYRDAYAHKPQALLTTPEEGPKRQGLLRRLHAHPWFNRAPTHPWSCWTHHNDVGCSSFKAECAFIFGSCRTFFGEPCRRGPPPLPIPLGDGAQAGHFAPNGPAGCNGCR